MANSILSNNPTQLLTKAKVNVSDWTEYTPTIIGFGTPTEVEFFYRRSGDILEVSGRFNSGTPTPTLSLIGIPSGLIIDSSRMPSFNHVVGKANRNIAGNSAGNDLNLVFTSNSNTAVSLTFNDITGYEPFSPPNANEVLAAGPSAAGSVCSVNFKVPIQGWSSEAEFLAPLVQPKTAFIKDVKPAGTEGGSASSGNYVTRSLNTLEGDSSFVSIDSNQITLKKGSYVIEVTAPAYRCSRHNIKLFNVTDSSDVIIGSVQYAAGDVSTDSTISGAFELIEDKVFEIRHYLQDAGTPGNGALGVATTSGDSSVFTQVKITKLL